MSIRSTIKKVVYSFWPHICDRDVTITKAHGLYQYKIYYCSKCGKFKERK